MGTRVAFKTAQESFPKSGNKELPVPLDFTAVGVINDGLYQEQSQSQIETIQCVYIDNSQNNAPFSIRFRKTQQLIVAQALTQGIYPVIEPGAIEYQASTTPGIIIQLIFSNSAKPYAVWGPVPGVTVVPVLTNAPLNFQPLAAADNTLIAGVPLKTIKVYRMLVTFGAGSNVEFFSGPSAGLNNLSGIINMFAGGSIMLQPSGIPWFVTAVGDGFVMNSSGAVNMGGLIGYVQS